MNYLSRFKNLLSTTHSTKERYILYNYDNYHFRICHQKFCRISGLEQRKKNTTEFFIPKTDSEEITRISLSRTKRNIKEIALCNHFEYFATMTVNSEFCDRFSLSECQDKIRKIMHKIKRIHKDFKFLLITEKHLNGAFHFHGLITGIPFYINNNGYYSCKYFDTLGFNSFSKIRDYTKVSNYILKYISKDCVKNEQNQIYFCSRGLKKASSEDIQPLSDVPYCFSNDYVDLYDFTLDTVPHDLLLKLILKKSD